MIIITPTAYVDESVPDDGTGVSGLYLEGAQWDEQAGQLVESSPNTRDVKTQSFTVIRFFISSSFVGNHALIIEGLSLLD